MIHLTNENCMDLMARFPDGYFDLAIVDPPYGGGASRNAQFPPDSGGDFPSTIRGKVRQVPASPARFGGRFDKYQFPEFKKKNDSRHGRALCKIRQGGGLAGRAEHGHRNTGRILTAGMWPRRPNTLANCAESQSGGLYGAEIIMTFRRPAILLSGAS